MRITVAIAHLQKAGTILLLLLTTLRQTRFGPRGLKPPCAFKVPMINVFCNSHCFSQLAAFFIGARAERSTTENCLSKWVPGSANNQTI